MDSNRNQDMTESMSPLKYFAPKDDELQTANMTILIDLTLHKVVTTTTAEPTEVPSIAATNTTIEVSLAAVETDSEIIEDALVDASVAADILEYALAAAPILPLNHHATTRRPRANTFMIPTILIRVTIPLCPG